MSEAPAVTRSSGEASGVRARSRCVAAIGWAGLIAGTLDILYVIVFFKLTTGNVAAVQILKGIAAGLLGSATARAGGNGMAALGLGLHFVIAFGAAAVFYAASRKIRLLIDHAVVSGLLYGVAVWLFMNLVVLPMSANPPKSFPSPIWIPVLIAHLLCVGLPIALTIRRIAR